VRRIRGNETGMRVPVAGVGNLDISQAAAFFSWANRLMLTLGEPYYAAE